MEQNEALTKAVKAGDHFVVPEHGWYLWSGYYAARESSKLAGLVHLAQHHGCLRKGRQRSIIAKRIERTIAPIAGTQQRQ